MKSALFVYNQHSGKAQIKNHLMDIVDLLTKADYEVTCYPTQFRQDAVEKVKNRDSKYDLVVCSGGDGTLDEVVTGMMASGFSTPIGYIPAGSTNDFASSLRIPKSMKEAARVIGEGNFFACDVGNFNDDTFVYIAAFGLFTDVSYETPQDMKNVLGHMAYVLEGMKRISYIKSYHMTVTSEDTVIEGDFAFGMVTNSISVGGFKNITGKNVTLDDGLFEVTLIRKPTNPIEMNLLVHNMVTRNFDTDMMITFKASRVEFECTENISWTLDGENGGIHRSVLIKNEKQAIQIAVPRK